MSISEGNYQFLVSTSTCLGFDALRCLKKGNLEGEKVHLLSMISISYHHMYEFRFALVTSRWNLKLMGGYILVLWYVATVSLPLYLSFVFLPSYNLYPAPLLKSHLSPWITTSSSLVIQDKLLPSSFHMILASLRKRMRANVSKLLHVCY